MEQVDVPQGAFDHTGGRYPSVFFQDVFFQRTGIDANTYGDSP